jgi:osmotically-inducible protein OsmY
MKKFLIIFLLGALVGGGGVWYMLEGLKPEAMSHFKEDLNQAADRAGVIIREKARKTGEALSDAASNARITGMIKAKLFGEPGLSAMSITVDTTDGFVTLCGTVSSQEQVDKAVKIALDTEGVHKVVSTLQIKPAK